MGYLVTTRSRWLSATYGGVLMPRLFYLASRQRFQVCLLPPTRAPIRQRDAWCVIAALPPLLQGQQLLLVSSGEPIS